MTPITQILQFRLPSSIDGTDFIPFRAIPCHVANCVNCWRVCMVDDTPAVRSRNPPLKNPSRRLPRLAKRNDLSDYTTFTPGWSQPADAWLELTCRMTLTNALEHGAKMEQVHRYAGPATRWPQRYPHNAALLPVPGAWRGRRGETYSDSLTKKTQSQWTRTMARLACALCR
jgi:hypothetical protein